MSVRPALDLPSLPPAPQRLGKYEIVGVLGEGAMGIVYKAVDPHLDRPVAIKAIRAPLLEPAAHAFGAARRFRTEAQAAGRLMHPNIVSVHEFGEDGPVRFLVMEYVEGVSLLELTAHGRRLPLDDVASVMAQLLDALAFAHVQGVWHRDIKPANLLLTADGRLKITDFGIACIDAAAGTQQTTVLGSPGYMAPERYTGETPDQRVDVFACGVLLYELLTGQAPFRGTSSAVMYQVLHDDPPPPSTLPIALAPPARLDAVVAGALAKRPADRYASAGQMHAALVEAIERPIAPTVSARTMRRSRADAADPPTKVLPRPAVAQSGPPSTGAPGWDATQLGGLERLLTDALGPVARLVVRDAARRLAPQAAIAQLAAEHLEPGERDAFVAAATRLLAPRTGAEAVRRTTPALPVLGTTPLRPELVTAAGHLLADHIGPIAGLIVRRACATTSSLEQFFAALVDAAGDEVDAKALLAELWRSAAPPREKAPGRH